MQNNKILMDQVHLSLLSTTTARQSRQQAADLILSNPEQFDVLLRYCFSRDKQLSHRACWVLEFVCHSRLEWILPKMDVFLKGIQSLAGSDRQNESCLRPLAKICEMLSERYLQKDPNFVLHLTSHHIHQIVEHCFDWLIGNHKVATKAYAMETLYNFRKVQPWISEHLKQILLTQREEHSAAYQTRSRKLLRKMSQEKSNN